MMNGSPYFNSQERNKKETEVMIHPFKISLVQTTNRAAPWVLVQYLRFGRYAGDEDHKKFGVLECWSTGLLEIKIGVGSFISQGASRTVAVGIAHRTG